MIEIDGALLEGGGQVVRNAFGLAALLGKAIHVVRIRANRQGGRGLKAQHLAGVQLVKNITGGVMRGDSLGSSEVWFEPTAGVPREEKEAHEGEQEEHFEADTKTAGSVALLIQIALPVLALRRGTSVTRLRGGTDATLAPLIGYMQHLLLPMLRERVGMDVDIDVVRRGFMPKGGGEVTMTSRGRGRVEPFEWLVRGEVVRVHAEVVGASEEQAAEVRTVLTSRLKREVHATRVEARGGGTLLVWAETEHGFRLGASGVLGKNQAWRELAARCATELSAELRHGGCVDQWMQDQVVVWMAVAQGTSSVRVGTAELTLHTRTAMHWAETMVDGVKFDLTDGVMRCTGGRGVVIY